MRRIGVVLVVGVLLGVGYSGTGKSWYRGERDVEHERDAVEAVNGTPEDAASEKSSAGERFKVTDSEVTPDPKADGAAEERASTGEEKIAWGKETDGLVANLRCLTTEPQLGEPIEFQIRVKNVSNEDVGLPSGDGREKMSPCFWKFYFDDWEWEAGARPSVRSDPLKPGKIADVLLDRRWGIHPPREGTYRVHAVFDTRDNPKPMRGEGDRLLRSNTIEVQIIDRR